MSKRIPSIWHFHLLIVSTLSTNLMLMVLEKSNLSPKNVFYHAINKVKEECEGVIRGLIDELHWQLPTHKVMTTLGVVYPQFWATNGNEIEKNFHTYLAILKAAFCVLHKMGENENVVHVLLSSQHLIWRHIFLRWPCCIMLKQFCEKKTTSTFFQSFGTKFLHLPYSTINSWNSSNWLLLPLSRCWVPLRINEPSIESTSWKIGCGTSLAHT